MKKQKKLPAMLILLVASIWLTSGCFSPGTAYGYQEPVVISGEEVIDALQEAALALTCLLLAHRLPFS
jgi:hypothetical protein